MHVFWNNFFADVTKAVEIFFIFFLPMVVNLVCILSTTIFNKFLVVVIAEKY